MPALRAELCDLRTCLCPVAEVAAYYGWNVAALAILVACGAWLVVKGSVAAGKFVVVLAGFTFAITVILR